MPSADGRVPSCCTIVDNIESAIICQAEFVGPHSVLTMPSLLEKYTAGCRGPVTRFSKLEGTAGSGKIDRMVRIVSVSRGLAGILKILFTQSKKMHPRRTRFR